MTKRRRPPTPAKPKIPDQPDQVAQENDSITAETEFRKQRYEAYVKEREKTDSNLLAMSDRYSKAMLTLAGGSLALSITFIEKIAPNPPAWTLAIVAASWVVLVLSVINELLAMHASQDAILAAQRANDLDYRRYLATIGMAVADPDFKPEQADVPRFNRKVEWHHKIALNTLIAGVLLMVLFSAINIQRLTEAKTMHKDPDTAANAYQAPALILPPAQPTPTTPPTVATQPTTAPPIQDAPSQDTQ